MRNGGHTLQRRLFAFFLLFLVAIMSGLMIILLSAGVFSMGRKESRIFLETELSHIADDVVKEFGTLSVEGTALSRKLTEQAEQIMQEQRSKGDFPENAELINNILEASSEPLLAALEKNTCSGVFLVLDATVGSHQPGAENSRAGVFFKNMEPNAVNKTFPTVRFLRGPSFIAKEEELDLLPQWRMEFIVAEDDFFHRTMSAANSGQELSRLYYWNPADKLAGDYETAILLCVPLITAEGEVLGICGFEVSSMLFKLQNTPDNSVHNRVFAMLSPLKDNTLCAQSALFSGSHTAPLATLNENFAIHPQSRGLTEYHAGNGAVYVGQHRTVNLYPRDAAHAEELWAVSVMIPETDFSAYIANANGKLYLLLSILLILSVGMALIVSRRYILPVVGAFDQMKSGTYEKTNILEIDDLFAYLAEQDKETAIGEQQKTFTLYDDFVKNIETLSPAERSVFNLYMEGYDANQITKILCLSINTIKTHNKRIFQKLSVSSRKELLVYVSMMREKDDLPPG